MQLATLRIAVIAFAAFAVAPIFPTPSTALAAALLSFDEVAEGTVLDESYAQSHRIHIRGIGDGGPFPVIAKTPCTNPASSPYVLSIDPVAECPETNDRNGWFEVVFEIEQSWVSIAAIHAGGGAVSYLKAYNGPAESDFIDQIFGAAGSETVGIAQELRIDRTSGELQIQRVRFGVFNTLVNEGAFDDLAFPNVPVPLAELSWGAMKSRF